MKLSNLKDWKTTSVALVLILVLGLLVAIDKVAFSDISDWLVVLVFGGGGTALLFAKDPPKKPAQPQDDELYEDQA